MWRDRLIIEHLGEEHVIEPSEELSFGRAGDLVVDVNPYLHRRLGAFRHDGRSWWVHNSGRRSSLTVMSVDDVSSATIGPGSSAPILHTGCIVAFAAGPAAYELICTREDAERAVDLGGSSVDGPLVTLEWGRVELNADQWDLLEVMCARRAARPADQWAPLPSNRECAVQLGWSLAKFNRKLDHVCERFARAGVRGLRGDLGGSAVDRRRVLVDHVIGARLLERRPASDADVDAGADAGAEAGADPGDVLSGSTRPARSTRRPA